MPEDHATRGDLAQDTRAGPPDSGSLPTVANELRGFRPNWIRLCACEHRNRRPFEPSPVEFVAKLGLGVGPSLEDRRFDAVIAAVLQLIQHRPMLPLHMVGPQQQVEANFHLNA